MILLFVLAAAAIAYFAGYARGFDAGRKWPLDRMERACPPHCIAEDGACQWCGTQVWAPHA